jgi:WD40 repeat protein
MKNMVGNLFHRQPQLNRRWKADLDDHVIALAWAPTGFLLAAASVSGPIALYNVADGKRTGTLAGHDFGTAALSWQASGQRLASAGQDGKVRLWDVTTHEECACWAGGASWVEHILWNADGTVLASAAGKKLRLWSADGQLVRAYADHPATIADLAWRPRSGELTSATYGGVALWNREQDQPTRRLEWKGSILKLAWSPDGAHLAHGNQDATVHYWILADGQDLQMAGYPMKVRQVCWDPTGRFLATGGGDMVTVWDCSPPGPEGSMPLNFSGHQGPISALAYQAKGPLLASGGQDGRLLLFQPGKFKKEVARSDLGAPVAQVLWSPDDRLLAAGTETGGVVVYLVG